MIPRYRVGESVRESPAQAPPLPLDSLAPSQCSMYNLLPVSESEWARPALSIGEYVRRMLRYRHMDFDYTLWQMLTLERPFAGFDRARMRDESRRRR